MNNRIISFFTLILINIVAFAQQGSLKGKIYVEGELTKDATIQLNRSLGTVSNTNGEFILESIPLGEYTAEISFVGYQTEYTIIEFTKSNSKREMNFYLTELDNNMDEIVVTGTKTFKRKTDSPVIVNVLNSKTLENVQACTLSDALNFQPGLRVETDCQTCNYTQLRMNGLAGGYSQILVNGRPIFSPLTGLYGMEQLPVNMIERIEVVRGGGSSLYGSSAIGGTVNVITKIPKKDSFELHYMYQNINNQTSENLINGNLTVLSKDRKAGVSLFVNRRERGFYDDNDDNYSELPKLKNTAFGTNLFFIPKENQKLEMSLGYMNEYRFGGEMVDKPAYLTQQSEERTHDVWMGNVDYQINFNDYKSSFIAYGAWQNTQRDHYTGIIPDDIIGYQNHIENPPYGVSDVSTFNVGIQLNHEIEEFIKGSNVFTFGAEYVYDDVFDEIIAYNYEVDQTTKNTGVFLQSDWELTDSFTILSGVRMDNHNLMDKAVFSPRVSLLYKHKKNTQFRLNYGAGFRAPQAFDTDLHIAFAGGGISRVFLSDDLKPEDSESFSASINYDKPTEHMIYGFTLEGFYTNLKDAFFLEPIGQDMFGELFEKQNGQGASVKGITLEGRINFDKKVQLESGFTIQTSQFEKKVSYIDGVEGIKDFIRTPKQYGFATLSITPNKKFSANLNYVYTGTMKMPHFAGAPNQTVDEMFTSPSFDEFSAKVAYTLDLENIGIRLELYSGVKNIFNEYQETFDVGKNRDSNFIYGPSQPRSVYVGVKLKSN